MGHDEVRGTGPRKDDVLIAGKFSSGSSSTQKNLVRVDGTTGNVQQWYNAPSLKSVLAAPDLGRIYGGGVSLTAFELSGRKLWTEAKTTVITSRYANAPSPGYRDLELDGQTIWAACACDAVDGNEAKALVKLRTDKLSTEGIHDASWIAGADLASWGMSVVKANGALYLGAGGSDYLAQYDKGRRQLLQPGPRLAARHLRLGAGGGGYGRTAGDRRALLGGRRPAWRQVSGTARGTQALDPNDECATRKGIAAYSFEGKLDPWSPTYAGKYSLVWALHVDETDETRLHTGGSSSP